MGHTLQRQLAGKPAGQGKRHCDWRKARTTGPRWRPPQKLVPRICSFFRAQHHDTVQRQHIHQRSSGVAGGAGRQTDQGIGGGKYGYQRGILILESARRSAGRWHPSSRHPADNVRAARWRARRAPARARRQLRFRIAAQHRRPASAEEKIGADQRRSRIARQAQHRPSAVLPNQVGLPGPHSHLFDREPKPKLHAAPAAHGHGRLPRRRRSPPADHFRADPCSRRAGDGRHVILRHAQTVRNAAPATDQRRNAVGRQNQRSGMGPASRQAQPVRRRWKEWQRAADAPPAACAIPDAAASDNPTPSSLRPAGSNIVPAVKSTTARPNVPSGLRHAAPPWYCSSRRTSSWITTLSAPSRHRGPGGNAHRRSRACRRRRSRDPPRIPHQAAIDRAYRRLCTA